MKICEVKADELIIKQLIELSKKWEAENSCHGYRANSKEDISGNRIFAALENDRIIAYLFGHSAKIDNMSSIIPVGSDCFDVLEIFVEEEYRNQGIGRLLFEYMEKAIDDEYIILSTATKNWKAILHCYIEEVGMAFHSAMLFKKTEKTSSQNSFSNN